MVDRFRGPSPLPYYLHAAALAHHQGLAMVMCDDPEQGWSETLKPAGDLLCGKVDPLELIHASNDRLRKMLNGIDAWRSHPYTRRVPDPEVIWSAGSARLLDIAPRNSGPAVLVVPSLINRHYILHLMEDASFAGRMAQGGVRPIILDWGRFHPGDPDIGIADYYRTVLRPAFCAAGEITGGPVSVLGYCMGGTLSVALAADPTVSVDKLGLIGAPWAFDRMSGVAAMLRDQSAHVPHEKLRALLAAFGQHFGAVPQDLFQYLFAVLAPMQVVQKFTRFADLPQDSAAARRFVAVEDWLADGSPVAASTAADVLIDWYLENRPASGRWDVYGAAVDPAEITCPTLILRGLRDHIVPPQVSAPLAHLIPDARSVDVDLGHVGMIVGGAAYAEVADRLSAFYCTATV